MHMTLKPEKKQKYRSKKTPCRHGHTHDSGKEARQCNELHLLQRAGEISELEVQVQYWFAINGVPVTHLNGRRCGIKLDFRFRENGKTVCADTKGFIVRDFPLRAAIFRALYPDIELREL